MNTVDPYLQDAGLLPKEEQKFNRAHDARGRFASAGGGGSAGAVSERIGTFNNMKVGDRFVLKEKAGEYRGKVDGIEHTGAGTRSLITSGGGKTRKITEGTIKGATGFQKV